MDTDGNAELVAHRDSRDFDVAGREGDIIARVVIDAIGVLVGGLALYFITPGAGIGDSTGGYASDRSVENTKVREEGAEVSRAVGAAGCCGVDVGAVSVFLDDISDDRNLGIDIGDKVTGDAVIPSRITPDSNRKVGRDGLGGRLDVVDVAWLDRLNLKVPVTVEVDAERVRDVIGGVCEFRTIRDEFSTVIDPGRRLVGVSQERGAAIVRSSPVNVFIADKPSGTSVIGRIAEALVVRGAGTEGVKVAATRDVKRSVSAAGRSGRVPSPVRIFVGREEEVVNAVSLEDSLGVRHWGLF